ncbi:hypothetical protein M378DRAFT_95200 [Amanita muscaria Koide BX008]|uniref:L-lactate dehydrogenase (cytochrome) n=1 Tax=Amanita muscaria (strain Koide BX008) TaxID=946122 RepID=A0A0C2TTQ6_AMAMK|nr:hypothetical protein M378DRAFT_95200 [Amanita muscaria Koide BX008]
MTSWTPQQVAAHNTASCWIIIHGQVYDVTKFLPEHPGGPQAILNYAGKDATEPFDTFHAPDALSHLPSEAHLGSIPIIAEAKSKTKDQARVEEAHKHKPPLYRVLNLADMEVIARKVLSHKAWAYYSSAADDEITHAENIRAFTRFFFLPRVMRPVSYCDPSTTILGYSSALPIFVSGAALAKLGHPLGEINITRGIYTSPSKQIIQMVSSNASLSFNEIAKAARQGQALFFQLYKNRDDMVAERRVRAVEEAGYKAIFLTVDAIVAGSRERDIRNPWILEDEERGGSPVYSEEMPSLDGANHLGTAGALTANDDRDMSWERTIPWLRSITKLPIAIKGIQCVEDAVLAAEAGVDAILLSNHGGRQLEYSLPPIEVLYRLRKQRPDVFSKLEVYIDGGIYRGTDVLKAVCLGARAVGLGRPFLYAQGAYGEAGVTKIIQILEREIVAGMRLLGAPTIKDLRPELVERIDWQPLVSKL